MMCQSCSSEARWIVVTPGSEYAGRVCDSHLRGGSITQGSTAYPRRAK